MNPKGTTGTLVPGGVFSGRGARTVEEGVGGIGVKGRFCGWYGSCGLHLCLGRRHRGARRDEKRRHWYSVAFFTGSSKPGRCLNFVDQTRPLRDDPLFGNSGRLRFWRGGGAEVGGQERSEAWLRRFLDEIQSFFVRGRLGSWGRLQGATGRGDEVCEFGPGGKTLGGVSSERPGTR